MAPRFSRRRRDKDAVGDGPASDEEPARLDDDEHAWWAQRDIDAVWTPREAPTLDDPPPERDVLADHFGEDWRTSFGFDEPAGPPGPGEPSPPEPTDPYEVLGIDASATWEEIVEAHRRLARHHHPDRLVGRTDAEVAAGEDRIRAINAAYAELKVRRGK